jgi:alanine-synthesizing transaminase
MVDTMFSRRASLDFTPNHQAALLAELQSRGVPITDLTLSNPTSAGFTYPETLLTPLADPASLRYEPSPLGLPETREAVSGDYARRGVRVPPDRIALTASTSEAYSLLFKLLCDDGDEVLVPAPSYPLFEHLARLDDVNPVTYPLEYHGRWSIDLAALERQIGPRTRGVLVVSPNNPTGSVLSTGELEGVADLCARHGLALVGDEVFSDYLFDPGRAGPSVIEQDRALAFSLGGLSKAAGLPQLKLGWVAVSGPAPLVTESTTRLELICDTYLSVSTPVQRAAPALLASASVVRGQIQQRTRTNRETLKRMVESTPAVSLLDADGGWYGVLRVPAVRSEEQLALELLREDHVLVHPGYFFDFPHEAFVVVSLLPQADEFTAGVRQLLSRAGRP